MTEHIHKSQVVEPGDQSSDMGLELRDWLAGQALVGLTVHAGSGLPYVVAEEAYKLADEMLKARREAATSGDRRLRKSLGVTASVTEARTSATRNAFLPLRKREVDKPPYGRTICILPS